MIEPNDDRREGLFTPTKRGLSFISKAKLATVCVLIGIVVGVVGTVFVTNFNPEDEKSTTATAVFERIVSENELVSVSQRYSVVDKASDSYTFFDLFDIPFTDNSFWYRYVGTLKAGVNMEDAEIEVNGNTATVTLNTPYIISNTPDMEQSGVLEERNNILNPIHVEDVDSFQAWCVEQGEQNAVDGGLLDEARLEVEDNIRRFFYVALGDECTVEFVWRDQQDAMQ